MGDDGLSIDRSGPVMMELERLIVGAEKERSESKESNIVVRCCDLLIQLIQMREPMVPIVLVHEHFCRAGEMA